MLTDIDFGVTDLGAWGIGERGRSVEDVAGILGAEQLTFNGALIDCRALKLWLQPLKRK